jgi:hypothetical protein
METKQQNNNLLNVLNEVREAGGYFNQNTGKTYAPSNLVQIAKINTVLSNIANQFLNAKDLDGNINPNTDGINLVNQIKKMVADDLKPIAQIHCDEQREYRAKQREIWSAKNVRNYSETVAGTVVSE